MAQVGDGGLLLDTSPASGCVGQDDPHVAAFGGVADLNHSARNQSCLEILGHFHAVLAPGTGSKASHAFQLYGVSAQVLEVGHIRATAKALRLNKRGSGVRRDHIAVGIQEANVVNVKDGGSCTLGSAIVHGQGDHHQRGILGELLAHHEEGRNLGVLLLHVNRPGAGHLAQLAGDKELHIAGAGIELPIGILNAHGHFDAEHIRCLLAQQAEHVKGDVGNLAIVVGDLQCLAAIVIGHLDGSGCSVGHALVNAYESGVSVLKVQADVALRHCGGQQRHHHDGGQNQSQKFVHLHFSFPP